VTAIDIAPFYEELLKLDERYARLVETMEETLLEAREANRELADGLARTEALKKRLFGDRFDHVAAAE
jgi:hypothetical protein